MKQRPLTHVSDGYSEPDTQLVIGASLWSAGRESRSGFRYWMPGAYVMAVLIPPELAYGQLKRYLLHCAQPYRTPKAT